MMSWMHRKAADLDAVPVEFRLKRTLSWWHLVALGVGGIVGTGIYTLVGVGANLAGPAVILSFLIAGVICACAALAYAEVATLIPAAGSAYTYSYVALGQIAAWIVGWSLILEYSLVVSAVAVGWSGYASGFLLSLGIKLPMTLTVGPYGGGMVNLPAITIIAVVTALLAAGTRESATLNSLLVAIKIAALLIFVAAVLPHFRSAAYHPFMPYGFAAHTASDGTTRGVMAAAAIIFFAFYGFDAISTAGEEARNPSRDLPIGIIGSLVICTLIYVAVAASAVGALPFTQYAQSSEPLAFILRSLGQDRVAAIIGAAAIIALPTVILAFLYGQSRILFVMARDGFIPISLARVSPRSGAPIRITIVTAIIVAVLAGVTPLEKIAALANAGTLLAFIAVAICMMVLRFRAPTQTRIFRVPLAWLVGPCAVIGCIYLFFSLPTTTRIFFFIWNIVGFIYFVLWNASSRAAQSISDS